MQAQPRSISTVWIFFIAAIGWILLSDQLLRTSSKLIESHSIVLSHLFNDLLIVTLIFILLYKVIKKQRNSLIVAVKDYSRLFESTPTPIFIYDPVSYHFLAVNKAAELQYGYTREELLTLSLADIRQRGELKSLEDVSGKYTPPDLETASWLHRDKSDNSFYVCVYTSDTFFNGHPAKQALVINIDEKIKTKEALQKKKEELENVFEIISEAFYVSR